MTPEERQMLSGLFDRIRGQANGPRDADAEAFIADAVRQQPYAPYLLAQTVLVQEQGLSAASQRIEELEAQVRAGAPGQRASSGSFLGDLGRSIFGGGQQAQPQQSRYQPQPNYQQPPNYEPQRGYPPGQSGPQGGPWGGGGQAQMMPQRGGGGGSFLHGALGTAAGVAGGVLLANSMQGLFSSHSATAATMAGGAATPSDGGSDWGSGAASSNDVAGQDSASDWGSGSTSNNDVASNDGGSDWGSGDNDSSFDV